AFVQVKIQAKYGGSAQQPKMLNRALGFQAFVLIFAVLLEEKRIKYDEKGHSPRLSGSCFPRSVKRF
ncbi:MAG TPA: hypothetical protein VFM90_00480, partial [Cyclobacteriaceae bacterium]|nr:hypothetical protein [Cyclobacteriaceae bacterium]